MEKPKTGEIKESIEKEAGFIVSYVSGFEVHSRKDQQALNDILNMMANIHTEIIQIEASHLRRIELMKEMSKTIIDMETDYQKFSEKFGKQVPGK